MSNGLSIRDIINVPLDIRQASPEHNLISAILVRGHLDFVLLKEAVDSKNEKGVSGISDGYADSCVKYRALRKWIRSGNRFEFSFLWICEHLTEDEPGEHALVETYRRSLGLKIQSLQEDQPMIF